MSKIIIYDEISSTLLIPLYYKAKESKRVKQGKSVILNDPKAELLISCIEGKYDVYEKDRFSNIGCLFRAKYFDDCVLTYCKQFDELVVINAACGLDSRYERIKDELKNKNVTFYNADLQEVINIRKQFFQDEPKSISIVGDLLDISWINEIKNKHQNAKFIVILEGILMYFDNESIKKIINNFSILKNAYIFADLIGSKMYLKEVEHKTISKLNIEFKSGIDGVCDFIRLFDSSLKLKAIKEDVYMKKYRCRYGLKGMFFGLFPKSFLKQFSSLIGVELI